MNCRSHVLHIDLETNLGPLCATHVHMISCRMCILAASVSLAGAQSSIQNPHRLGATSGCAVDCPRVLKSSRLRACAVSLYYVVALLCMFLHPPYGPLCIKFNGVLLDGRCSRVAGCLSQGHTSFRRRSRRIIINGPRTQRCHASCYHAGETNDV